MANIASWSTVADDNTTIAPPATMQINQLDNAVRTVQGSVRQFANELPWYQYGSGVGQQAAVYSSGTSFRFAADLRTVFAKGRRVRVTGAITGTVTGTITSSTYSDPDTTIVAEWDSGSLTSEPLTAAVSVVTPEAVPALAGRDIILDADLDTRIEGSTDDEIRFTFGDALRHKFWPGYIDIFSVDATDTEGPFLRLFRQSASPAASDQIGAIQYFGRNSAGTDKLLAELSSVIVATTEDAESSVLDMRVQDAGTLELILRARPDMALIGKAAGDSGATAGVELHTDGSVYATSVALSDTATPLTIDFTGYSSGTVTLASFEVDGTEQAAITWDGTKARLTGQVGNFEQLVTSWTTSTAYGPYAHSLGDVPDTFDLYAVAKATSLGYSSGDRVKLELFGSSDTVGASAWANATQVGFRTLSNGVFVLEKDTDGRSEITDTNWNLLVVARPLRD